MVSHIDSSRDVDEKMIKSCIDREDVEVKAVVEYQGNVGLLINWFVVQLNPFPIYLKDEGQRSKYQNYNNKQTKVTPQRQETPRVTPSLLEMVEAKVTSNQL